MPKPKKTTKFKPLRPRKGAHSFLGTLPERGVSHTFKHEITIEHNRKPIRLKVTIAGGKFYVLERGKYYPIPKEIFKEIPESTKTLLKNQAKRYS